MWGLNNFYLTNITFNIILNIKYNYNIIFKTNIFFIIIFLCFINSWNFFFC